MKPFLQRVAEKMTIDSNGCWEWTGAFNNVVIPVVGWTIRGRPTTVSVRRALYAIYVAPVETWDRLESRCGNYACVSPWHVIPEKEINTIDYTTFGLDEMPDSHSTPLDYK